MLRHQRASHDLSFRGSGHTVEHLVEAWALYPAAQYLLRQICFGYVIFLTMIRKLLASFKNIGGVADLILKCKLRNDGEWGDQMALILCSLNPCCPSAPSLCVIFSSMAGLLHWPIIPFACCSNREQHGKHTEILLNVGVHVS